MFTAIVGTRALVNLMSDEDSPDMPGLLYEAEIPQGLKRPVMSGRKDDNNNDEEEDDNMLHLLRNYNHFMNEGEENNEDTKPDASFLVPNHLLSSNGI